MNDIRTAASEVDTPAPRISIRKMTLRDVDAYCTLFQDVFAAPPWNEKWDLSAISSDIKKLMRKKGFFGLTAEMTSASIGFVTGFRLRLIPSLFYMDQLFVNADYQGNKIGTLLLSEMTSLLGCRGVSKTVLLTKPNSAAECFYKSGGYTRFLPPIAINGKVIFHKNI